MCVIMVKTKKVELPKKEYLKNCFDNNDDGAGLMYTDNGQVVIEKGFMSWGSFERRYDELCRKYNNFNGKSLVCHFRIGTQGKNDEHTCHPFPISSKFKMLRKTNLRTDVGMVHNGIISDFGHNSIYAKLEASNSLLSDTQLFIKYCVNSFKSLNRNFYKNKQVMEYLDTVVGGKLAFLDKEDNVYLIGQYEQKDGVYYSNSTYSYNYKNWGSYYNYGRNYGWSYEDDDKVETKIEDKIEDKIEEDIELEDYNGSFIPGVNGNLTGCEYMDVCGYLEEIKEGSQVMLVTTNTLFKVGKENIYLHDEYDDSIYVLNDYGYLEFLDWGWVDSE